jgi:methionyl-tRNA synthetase
MTLSTLITTPIYYPNAAPHLGHAYCDIAADTQARYYRSLGHQVLLLTGTDEHGQKIARAAEDRGLTPQQHVDQQSQHFRDLAAAVTMSNDDFIRTTEPRHHESAQAFWRALASAAAPDGQPNVYLGRYAGWYAARDETFYQEAELVNGLAPTGAPVEWVEEETFYFRLSAWQDRLLAYFNAHPDAIQPASRRNEVLAFIERGLTDLSISRTGITWGIPVPDAPGHVMYVWTDALVNYLSAIGYPDVNSARFQQFWPAKLHLVGKDIIRFHCIIWPAMLMAVGLPVPQRVFAHGFFISGGQKMSKSVGNVVDPFALVERYGADSLRFYVLNEFAFGQDGDFQEGNLVQRHNSMLANDLGNLAQRSLSMIQRYRGGQLPAWVGAEAAEQALLDLMLAALPLYHHAMEQQAFHKALEAVWQVVTAANQYVDQQAPWTLHKQASPRLDGVLRLLAEVLAWLSVALHPFMPTTMALLQDNLQLADGSRNLLALDSDQALLVDGLQLAPPLPLFPRVEVRGEEGAA